jgi:two-component system response regulator CpxR
MAIITIFSAAYCKENEIVNKLAEKVGYALLEDKLCDETSKRFNISVDKLKKTLTGQIPFLNNITHEREKNTAYIKATLAELVKADNVIYHGYASHLFPKKITHILKVGIIANQEYRIRCAMEEENISEQSAKHRIKKDEEKRFIWVQFLLNASPWDESLYDILIPMHKTSVDETVSIIVENVQKQALETTPKSQKAMDDFILASKVNVPLVENGYDVNVDNDSGKIMISLKEYVIRLEHLKKKLIKIVSPLSGVKEVDVIMSPNVKIPSRYDELKAQPPRFLLVDDEKEYVQTLSQRLQVRDVESAIAYDGEEALSYLEKDEPDVMVLDLKMPGINGMDVLRKVKKERPHVEVIILTGHGSEKDKALSMELGAFAYLEKPVDIEVLTKIMKEAYKKINKSRK